ncbi:MAG: lamin tail domain-containing protein [Candidatus Moraniibacteriota bacterium]
MLKKIRRSAINRRIFKSFERLAVLSLFLIFAFSFRQISGTRSFYASPVASTGNAFSAGYWIVPEVEVTSPEDDDEWQVGSSQDIEWTADSSDPSATAGMLIGIDYACDGDLWTNIVTGTNNDGSYPWTVPTDISDNCKVRVTATDSHLLSAFDESDEFEISWMVVLNEFVPDPILGDSLPKPGGEWVELYNNGSLDIDVSGWYLYDNNDSHELLISNSNGNNDNNPFDSGESIVPAGGHLVVFRNGDGDFALNNNGSDSVRLYDGEIGAGANLIDAYDYEIASDSDAFDALNTRGNENMLMPGGIWDETWPGKSFARYPDGTGDWYDPVPTPGEDNSQSLEVDDFKNFFEEWCLDKNGDLVDDNPSCDINLLVALGLLEGEEEIIPTPTPDPPLASEVDPALEVTPTPTETPNAEVTPTPTPDATPTPEPTPTEEPKVNPTPEPIIDEPENDPASDVEDEDENIEEEKAKLEAEEKAKAEAEAKEKAKLEAEAKAKAEEAKLEAEKKAEEEKAKKEAEEKAKKEEEEKAKKEEDHNPGEEAQG